MWNAVFVVGVVTDVVHNVHTIPIRENSDRALLAFFQLCGVKAPLTEDAGTGHLLAPSLKWIK